MESDSVKTDNKVFDFHSIRAVSVMILVCPENIEEKFTERLRQLGARGIVVTRGSGSARPSIKELLGFDNNDKSIILCVAHDNTAAEILSIIGKEFFTAHGSGIGLSLKADGFAGARYLFRSLITQRAAKIDAITEAFKNETIHQMFAKNTLDEIIRSDEFNNILKERDVELSSDDIEKLISLGKIHEILRSDEIKNLFISKGIMLQEFNEEINNEKIIELVKSEKMQDLFKSGKMMEVLQSEEMHAIFAEHGYETFLTPDFKKELKHSGMFEAIMHPEIKSLFKKSGITGVLKSKIFNDMLPNDTEEHKERAMSDNKLIMTIVNRGFSENVMDAARSAGATGGTIIWGRGTGGLDKSFFGVRIEPEKEIVMIVAPKDKCKGIVESINEKAGLKTPGSGICFILPVDDVVGLTPIDSGVNNAE